MRNEKESFEYLSGKINDNFKWHKVHKEMVAIDWEWSLGDGPFGDHGLCVPSIVDLKECAYNLLKEAYESGETISTGGFSAGWDDDSLYLQFILEDWYS